MLDGGEAGQHYYEERNSGRVNNNSWEDGVKGGSVFLGVQCPFQLSSTGAALHQSTQMQVKLNEGIRLPPDIITTTKPRSGTMVHACNLSYIQEGTAVPYNTTMTKVLLSEFIIQKTLLLSLHLFNEAVIS